MEKLFQPYRSSVYYSRDTSHLFSLYYYKRKLSFNLPYIGKYLPYQDWTWSDCIFLTWMKKKYCLRCLYTFSPLKKNQLFYLWEMDAIQLIFSSPHSKIPKSSFKSDAHAAWIFYKMVPYFMEPNVPSPEWWTDHCVW